MHILSPVTDNCPSWICFLEIVNITFHAKWCCKWIAKAFLHHTVQMLILILAFTAAYVSKAHFQMVYLKWKCIKGTSLRGRFRMTSERFRFDWITVLTLCTWTDRQTSANSADQGQMPQNAASDQGLCCLSFTPQQFYTHSQVVKLDIEEKYKVKNKGC